MFLLKQIAGLMKSAPGHICPRRNETSEGWEQTDHQAQADPCFEILMSHVRILTMLYLLFYLHMWSGGLELRDYAVCEIFVTVRKNSESMEVQMSLLHYF